MLTSSTDIQYLKGVGEKRAELLKKKGIDTVGALLRLYPRAYIDWQNIMPIAECPFNTNVCVKAKIISPIEESFIRGGMTIYKFMAEDTSGVIAVTLFNQKFLAEKLRTDNKYLFYGKLGGDFAIRQMSSPAIIETSFAGIEPIYPASGKISSKMLENLIKNALNSCVELPDILPMSIRNNLSLCDYKTALHNIHFPKTSQLLETAKKRLVFEELFVLQTGLLFLKKRDRGFTDCIIKNDYLSEFKNTLSFPLTHAQERTIKECLSDISSGKPMNRLVQGDVGCGKTAVAAALCYIISKNGFQSAFMAPTEILAEQHYKTLCEITRNSNIKCALLKGSLTKKQKDIVKNELLNGDIDVCIGTHALISDTVEFKNLGLVITDEQHRFGVEQRGKLKAKGNNPHILVMSATPIPRTLGLIIYGDLDISIIDEYPSGRKKIETFCVDSTYHKRIYQFIKKFLDEGRQGYIVCPLVTENDALSVTSATEYYETLKDGEFKNYNLGLLHGKISAKEKESVMHKFAEGEIQLLIATTVIEVGIDVPNAVVMVIENAERFGLSQLHQLRGRIGRGKYDSTCVLVSDTMSSETQKRLNVIKNCRDGFKIADEDLTLRGPGDFLGNRQHGLPEMKIADIFANRDILKLAGVEAHNLLENDSKLILPENQLLKSEIVALYKKLNQN